MKFSIYILSVIIRIFKRNFAPHNYYTLCAYTEIYVLQSLMDFYSSLMKENMPTKSFKNFLKRDKRWGSRDRGFVAETTYDIVRWKRLVC